MSSLPDPTAPNSAEIVPAAAADALTAPSPTLSASAVEHAQRGDRESASSDPTENGAGAPASDAHASAAADESGSDDGEASGEAGETATAAGGDEQKRKRRRRRKKKPAGSEGETAQAGEGAASSEAAGAGGEKSKRGPKKDRPERERPAFNVGDVVFGKVLEVTEDALFVDLSGKAKAIFDLRELLITEEEAEEYNRAHKADRKAAQQEEAAVAAGEAAASPAVEAAPAESESVQAASLPESAGTEAAAAESVQDASTQSEGAAAHEAVSGETPAVAEDKAPQLPRVILEPGAPFVGLVHNDGGRGGLVVLTHHPKRVSKTKGLVAEALRTGNLVFGLVTGTIKGGVEVDVDGLRAFAPASHVDLRPGADLSHLVGKRLGFAVTQYGKRGRDVVLSRRAILESEAKEKREEALKTVTFGAIVDGVVRTVVPFGAFVDIGGVEGLVPLSEMSHNRSEGPKDVFKVNETVKVKVLRLDEKGKLWLSRKAAIDDPWMQIATKYAAGTRHHVKVVRVQPFGAFVELEPGIDGLIHSADLSIKRIEHAEEVAKVGDELDVIVAHVDAHHRRIALHPAPTGEAADEEPQRIAPGKVVKVVVVNAEMTGLTVRVRGVTGRHARGFITAAATGTPRGTELRKIFPVGKELEVKIVEMDPRRGELKLSIKALAEETERNAYQTYRAQVKREAKFGTLADLLQKRNLTPSK